MTGADTRAQEILDRLSTALLLCDARLNVVMMNPAGEMMFGVSAKQTRGQPLGMLTPGDADALTLPAGKVLSTMQSITAHDATLQLAGGHQVKVDYAITPLHEADGAGLLIELQQVDGYMHMARDQHLADQYAANRQVLRGLAHEVKNPLGGLRGAAQLLERELSDPSITQYTRIIIHEADRLRNLVDRVIGSHRPIEFRATNIHEVLEHVRKLVLAEVQGGINIERDYDPSLPPLHGDRYQLIQAVLNIARNAVEASERSGVIRFRTRVERSVYVDQQWHRWVIRVDIEDDGPGVPEHLRQHLFYPMVTGRAEGSGLGLSIAQDIVNKHRGAIHLESGADPTCFSLRLPFDSCVESNGC